MSDNFEEFFGKKITSTRLDDERLIIEFEGDIALQIYDDGQSCCEYRYMSTDDDIQSLVGHTLVSIIEKEGPIEDDDYGDVHETCFVEVQTNVGSITLVNHNENNGYYCGFCMVAKKVEK